MLKPLTGIIALWVAGVGGVAYLLGAPDTFYAAVAHGARQLMPAHFKKMLEHRRGPMAAGLQPSPVADDRLIEQIEARAQNLKARLAENVPFSAVAAEYGVLARLIAELGDPSRPAAGPPHEALRREWHALLEKRHGKLPVVFYGYEATLFQERRLRAYLESVDQRARSAGEQLARTYAPDGRLRPFADADERSPAFGIAALYYSHTISDVANVWLYIWWESYGDVRGTPFFDVTARP